MIMEYIIVPIILLTVVVLIVSLTYIIVTTRHKERMALLEKGLDPKEYMNDKFLPHTLRAGMLLLGVGLGFLIAMILDEFVLVQVDNPAIYGGSVLVCGGLGLIVFYLSAKRKSPINKN